MKEKVSVTIDATILAKIRTQAEEESRTLSSMMNLILKNHVIAGTIKDQE